jgi:SAM-dependent methyltransferase
MTNFNFQNAQSILVSALTMGSDSQSFISAGWLVSLLRICPEPFKKDLALRILSLSPHYFYRHVDSKYEAMPYREFIEAELRRNIAAREQIVDLILKPYLKSDFSVLDYGCGPGYLAKAISAHVNKVFAADISKGVLACAGIISPAPNVEYLYVGDIPGKIPDGSLDLIVSFAVIQHVTDDVYDGILENCHKKLKSDGRVLFHVELENDRWKSEETWRSDTSIVGKVKLQYGLNCFGRKLSYFSEAAAKHGFKITISEPFRAITKIHFDDVCDGHMIVMAKV